MRKIRSKEYTNDATRNRFNTFEYSFLINSEKRETQRGFLAIYLSRTYQIDLSTKHDDKVAFITKLSY